MQVIHAKTHHVLLALWALLIIAVVAVVHLRQSQHHQVRFVPDFPPVEVPEVEHSSPHTWEVMSQVEAKLEQLIERG